MPSLVSGRNHSFRPPLDRALEMATTDMVQYLTQHYELEEWAAHLLIAFQGRYEVVTVTGSMALGDPAVRVAAEVMEVLTAGVRLHAKMPWPRYSSVQKQRAIVNANYFPIARFQPRQAVWS